MNIFEKANTRLEDFIKNDLHSYHELRNYDFGVYNRRNVSQISKYTSHRILLEYEIIEKLKTVDRKQKFTDEIIWRIYWRGYLENHKSIWESYKNFTEFSYDSTLLKVANNGATGIECFDNWIEELRENNYLHNHSRMWFASIWIFTFGLPWQLGARLFIKHLYDGDAASNTLSWRWIAGLHTNKKPYLASKENINKFTQNRFKSTPINISNKINIIKSIKHQSNKTPSKINTPISKVLFMFENDMNISNRYKFFNSYSKIYIIFNHTFEDKFKLSKNVLNFKRALIENVNNLISNAEIISSHDLNIILDPLKSIDVIYPGVGSNLDFINKCSNRKQIKINYIYRKEDLASWDNANSGFFKFKSKFYSDNNL